MKYTVSKKTIVTNVVFTVLFSAVCFHFVGWLCIKDVCNASILGIVLLQPIIFIPLALSDIKAYALVDREFLSFRRYGRGVTVDWTSIQKLEHKKAIWKTGFSRMLIHTSAPGVTICIDTSFENYKELCRAVISSYGKASESPCIDEALIKLLK